MKRQGGGEEREDTIHETRDEGEVKRARKPRGDSRLAIEIRYCVVGDYLVVSFHPSFFLS